MFTRRSRRAEAGPDLLDRTRNLYLIRHINSQVPKLLFHDTRQTTVRLMEQAGIPRAEAMQITDHKTESVYKRYDIGSERGATETGKRLREHW